MTAVIQLDRYRDESKRPEQKTGVIRKPGSKKLYIDLRPNGIRVQKSSGLDDTPENEKTLQRWIDRQKERIGNGTFVFAEAFPNASEKEKSKHAALEGSIYTPDTGRVLFSDYIKVWRIKNLDGFSPGQKRDYEGIIDYWLLPFFKDKSFNQITGVSLKDFIKQLNWKTGKKKGTPLSASRVSNILIVLRAIWYDAVEEYQWNRSDPFRFCKRFLRKNLKTRHQKTEPDVFRFNEWERILENMHTFFKPAAEIMIMTGMIGSEMAGLKKSAIKKGHIVIENSIVRGHEKAQLKTEYRQREIPMTERLKELFNQALYRSDSEYVFQNYWGGSFCGESFRKGAWKTALKKAGVSYRVPYSMRHTFLPRGR